jgi:hypothetical protein
VLAQAYGEWAFSAITPLTFELPSQLQEWVAHMKAQARTRLTASVLKNGTGAKDYAGGKPLWILKTSQHLGVCGVS